MKKLFKVLAVLFSAFVVLLIGAAVAIRIYFPPAKLKAMVIEQAENALHRKVEVAAVDLSLLRGLRIEGVRISEKPDFKKGDFLKADSFTFRFAWLPLLNKQLVAHEISLDGLQVTVKKHKDGTTNIPDLAAATAKAPETTSPPRPSSRKREEGGAGSSAVGLAALSVESLRLKGAQVRYVDEAAKSEALVKVPLAQVKRFALSGQFPFSAKLELAYRAGKESRTAILESDGVVDLAGLEPAKMLLAVRKLSVQTGGVAVTGTLKLQDAASPKVEGEFSVPALDAKTLASLAPGAFPDGLELPAAHLSFTAASQPPALKVSAFNLELAGLAVTGKLSIPDTGAKIQRLTFEAASNTFEVKPLAELLPAARGKLPAGKAAFKVSASKTGDALDLKQFTFAFGDAQASITGRISGLDSKDPALRLALETGSISFASFASYLPEISALTGKAKLSAVIDGTVAAPKVSGTFELADAGAGYLKQKLEKFTGTVHFSETSVDIPKLTGRVNGGDLNLKFSAKDPKAPVIILNGSLSLLDAGALEALMAKTPGQTAAPAQAAAKAPPYTGPVLRTSGAFTIEKITHPNFSSGKAVLDWNLTGVTPEFKAMDGSAKLRVGSGKAVKILALAKEKGGMARAMVVPLEILDKTRGKIPGLSIPSLEEIPFDRIEGDYTFNKGVMSMQPSMLEGPVVAAETRGTVDLPAQTLDLRSVLKATSLGNVALLVTGSMDDPKIQPDLTKVKEKITEKATEKGKELLKKQGEKLLRGLFNK